MKMITLICIVLLFQAPLDAQIGRLALSPLQTTTQKIAKTEVEIVYCRPSTRGRTIFGGLEKYGDYWRTGANRNTTIKFADPVFLNGTKVPPGKYAIFTIPNESEWEFFLYKDTDNWDVPEVVEKDKIAASIVVPSLKTEAHYESLNIGIEAFTNYSFDLSIYWENTKIQVPFQLNTKEVMEKKLADVLGGPRYSDYYTAAEYEMESGHNYARGLEWIEKAIELADPPTWWDYRIKAKLLRGLGRNDEVKVLAMKGLEMAKEDKRAYGIREFENILSSLE